MAETSQHVNPVEELASMLSGWRDFSPPATRVGELVSLSDSGGMWTGTIRVEGDPTQVRKVVWSGVGSRPAPGQIVHYADADGAMPLIYGSPQVTGAQRFGADAVSAGSYNDGQGNLRTGITQVQGSLGDLNITVDVQGANLTNLQNATNSLQGSVSGLQGSVSGLQGSVSGLQGTVNSQGSAIASLQSAVNALQASTSTIQQMQSQIANLQSVDVSLSNRIGSIEGIGLGNVLPQLQNAVNAAQNTANSAQNTANSAANSAATAVSTANAVGGRVTTLENRLAFYESNMTALANMQGQVNNAVSTANAASSTANGVRNAYNAHTHNYTDFSGQFETFSIGRTSGGTNNPA